VISPLDERLERELPNRDFVNAMREGIAKFHLYRDRVPYVPYAYTRMLLKRCAEYELVIMQWATGSQSAIHDHGDSSCWAALLDGSLEIENFNRIAEDREGYARLNMQSSATLLAGDLDSRSGPEELHRVRNTGEVNTFSLQLYAAPIRKYTVIDDRSGRCYSVSAQYDASVDLDSY
jgi:predicted metal-dependent enzyme (double-stranded beta helix superfamily)